TSVADGRIFSGAQAKAQKLVDELGTLQDAINEAAKEAKLTGKPDVVYPSSNRRKWLEMLLDEGKDDDSGDYSGPVLGGVLSKLIRAWGGLGQVIERQELPVLQPGIYWLWR